MNELKPCPDCGGFRFTVKLNYFSQGVEAHCQVCHTVRIVEKTIQVTLEQSHWHPASEKPEMGRGLAVFTKCGACYSVMWNHWCRLHEDDHWCYAPEPKRDEFEEWFTGYDGKLAYDAAKAGWQAALKSGEGK